MKLFKVFHWLILILFTTSSAKAQLDSAKPGCKESCGGVGIPYPFGIGPNCSVNKWYAVDCNSSVPYLSVFGNQLELLDVSLDDQVVTVNISKISDCQINHVQSVDLNGSPFVFSNSHNVFIAEGCGNVVLRENGSVVTGCSASCPNDTTTAIGYRDYCVGIGCCRTMIRYNLKSYGVDLRPLERVGGDGACRRSAFLLAKTYDEGWYYRDHEALVGNNSIVPVSLVWMLTDDDLKEVPSCWQEERWVYVEFSNRSVNTKKCSCSSGRRGNPYLHYQCEESEECRACRISGGICNNDVRYPNDFNRSRNFFCGNPIVYHNRNDTTQDFRSSNSPLGVILAVVGNILALALKDRLARVRAPLGTKKAKGLIDLFCGIQLMTGLRVGSGASPWVGLRSAHGRDGLVGARMDPNTPETHEYDEMHRYPTTTSRKNPPPKLRDSTTKTTIKRPESPIPETVMTKP
ncbi:hypothetical protein OSB04_027779 [Centaurea solstitialis]|uniref:Wall-associated receptor kinase galacturonan-binding domain-containing protein n=1 Tax=Centaurea solstitialis TaxID=347529 RepID=A0AA38SF94_9ASTR|nr:hypothetical protein OSB04_027779 [Centaurea solstitialis]